MGNHSSRNDEGSPQQQAQNQPVLAPHIRNSSNNYHGSSRSNSDNRNVMRETIKLPHNVEDIIQGSDSPLVDRSSPQKLLEQLRAGIFLNAKKMKYCVKEDSINCFLVLAKSLQITWGDDLRYWNYQQINTSEEGEITVAVLKNVCWLEVHGTFHTKNLTPGVMYEVAYLIMLEESSYGWTVPVNFKLTLPNETKHEHEENLSRRPRDEWIRIPVGEFQASTENFGDIKFSLYEFVGGNWKKGLIIKGVVIEPKI